MSAMVRCPTGANVGSGESDARPASPVAAGLHYDAVNAEPWIPRRFVWLLMSTTTIRMPDKGG